MVSLQPLEQLRRLSVRGVPWGKHSGSFVTGGSGTVPAAVLILFGQESGVGRAPNDLDLLFVERARTLREHPGQVAFPGGRIDAEDGGPVRAALREAWEETAVIPEDVEVLGQLESLPLPVSDYQVTPVLGWWQRPSPVYAVDPAESSRVFRVPISELVSPENRASARLVRGGETLVGPAFSAHGTVIWGFTGIILSDLLGELGWDQPWDTERVIDVLP